MVQLKAFVMRKLRNIWAILDGAKQYSTISTWTISIALEIANRLHVNRDIKMGWKISELLCSTLNKSRCWAWKIKLATQIQLCWTFESILNCIAMPWASINSANNFFNLIVLLLLRWAVLLIVRRICRVSLVVATAKEYVAIPSAKVHAIIKYS